MAHQRGFAEAGRSAEQREFAAQAGIQQGQQALAYDQIQLVVDEYML